MERRRVRVLLQRVALAMGALVLGLLMTVKLLYGRGTPYPDVGGRPRIDAADVTVIGSFEFPLGNVAGSRDGRVFFNIHPMAQAWRFTDTFFYELVDGRARPYPDAQSQSDLRFVFGMTVDAQNRLWLTAPGLLERERTRLIAYDLATNTRVIDHELETGVARFGQDLRVAPDGRTVFLANPGVLRFSAATLTVVDVATWRAREVLGDVASIQAQDWVMSIGGGPYRVAYGLLTFGGGLDGIAITPDGRWLLLAGMSNDGVYRVPLESLVDASLSSTDLAQRVERIGPKPLSDGIDAAPDGSALVTDVEHGGITRVDPTSGARSLVRIPAVAWADGVYVGPKGDVYFTDSALPRYVQPLLGPPPLDRLRAGGPYHLYRFHLPSEPASP